MAKAAYRSNSTKSGTTPHCLQTTVQKMAQIEKRLPVVQRAEPRAEVCAERYAAPVGRPVYSRQWHFLLLSSSGACRETVNRSLRWSYSQGRLPVSYKQVAPLELKTLCKSSCRTPCRYLCRSSCSHPCSSSCRKK
jgi:hypothetical protein